MKPLLLTLTLCAFSVSCGNTVPVSAVVPAPPNSPQTQVLNIDKTLADAINTAVKTAITWRDQAALKVTTDCPNQPQCTSDRANLLSVQANTTLIENWCKSASIVDDAIAAELGSSDSWTVQKQKILLLLTSVRVPGSSTLDISIQTALSTVSAVITQLQLQVTQ